MQMKRQGSLQITSINQQSNDHQYGVDAYRKYVQSLHSLERERTDGGLKKFAAQATGFIGNLMKTKSTNCHLNKLNESAAFKSEGILYVCDDKFFLAALVTEFL